MKNAKLILKVQAKLTIVEKVKNTISRNSRLSRKAFLVFSIGTTFERICAV